MSAFLHRILWKKQSLYLGCLRHLCTVESLDQEIRLVDRLRKASKSDTSKGVLCRTSQSDPKLHTINHEGLYYTVEDQHAAKFFSKGQRKHLLRMFKSFNETCIMVRQPSLEVINCLKIGNYNFPAIRYILYGPYGAGKTVTLGHIMHYCGLNDWLVIHIPWAGRFTGYVKEATLSSSRPGRVDTPVESLEWLKEFKKINELFLSKHNLSIQGSYIWTKRDHSEAGSSWLELINVAVERPRYATDVMNVLVKEIKQQASQKKFKALVAIDGVNSFWKKTETRRNEDRRLFYDSSEMSVIHNLKKLLDNDWTNGAVVCTVDRKASSSDQMESDLPLYLLKQPGFELFDPFIPIHVGNFNDKEMYSALEYYTDRKWIQNPAGLTDEGKKEIIFLSCNNPLELYGVTRGW